MAAAARARDGQASFTAYMADPNWRALRREAEDIDATRSSLLEACYERHLMKATAEERAEDQARAQEITQQGRRRRVD